VEVQFYVLIAIVVGIAGRRGLWVVFPGCVLLTALRVANGAYVDIATHLRADEILAGACIGLVYNGRSKFPTSYLLLTCLVLLWITCSSPITGGLQYLRPYASALLILATLNHGQTWVGKVLTTRAMRYVAAISYALYVIHHGLIQGWWDEGSTFERYSFKRPLSFALTFLLAHLSTFYWERFWLDTARTWISKKDKATEPNSNKPQASFEIFHS
jgi:peptidoglycan/LPS O-acetylase OafA/YrhL